MKQKLIRVARRVGTSSGVILPIGLLGATVQVSVLQEPVSPLLDSLKILEKHKLSSDVLSIGLIGSHARGENNVDSDVDILIISESVNMTIEEGKYSVVIVSKNELEKSLKSNSIYYFPMIREAIPLMNEHLLNYFKKYEVGSSWRTFTKDTMGALSKAKKMIELDEKLGNKNTGDSVAYSLVLRLRSLYLLKMIGEKKKATNREFSKLVSSVMYERYKAVKSGKMLNKTPIVEAVKMIKNIEKWLKEKKD
jgi:predicted nucleotidyltransferase